MKAKIEYILLLLVIAGLVIYLALRSADRTHFELPSPPSINNSEIDRLVVSKKGQAIELARKDDQWFIEPQGYPADNIKVKNMVNAAADLRITALVSESGNYARYDLGEDKSIGVKLFVDGKEQRRFDIGRTAPTYQHTFVKLADDPNIYHARGTLQQTFDQSIENLRDKTVLRFDKSSISSIAIRKGEQAVTLTKGKPPETQPKAETPQGKEADPSQWRTEDGRVVDTAAVDRLLSTMCELKCDSFIDDAAKKENQKPSLTLNFKSDQKTRSLSIFSTENEKAERVSARSSDSAYDFEFLESRVQTFEKQVDKLLTSMPPK